MKVKAILTIVISLLIGFVFGYLTSGQIIKRKWENKHKHSYHEMFVYRTLGVLSPSEGQKDTLLPIIENYADKAVLLKNKVSSEFDSLMHQMTDELKPFVSPEQFKKLEENEASVKLRYRK